MQSSKEFTEAAGTIKMVLSVCQEEIQNYSNMGLLLAQTFPYLSSECCQGGTVDVHYATSYSISYFEALCGQ